MPYPTDRRCISLWRMLHPHRQNAPHSGEGARLYGGRWNMKGWPALYLSTDPATAVAEYYQGLPKPGMLAPYRLDAAAIADLTDGGTKPADVRVADALSAAWKQVALIDGQVPPGWAIAQELIAAGAEGALVPSAQNRGGCNLVLWRWHDAAAAGTSGAGAGAALTLLDADATLAPTPGTR